jgi:hypothetical protein
MATDQLQAVSKPRLARSGKEIKERVEAFVDAEPAANVMPLNPGFFKLQRMRAAGGAKVRE